MVTAPQDVKTSAIDTGSSRVFPSKWDGWLVLLLWPSVLGMIFSAFVVSDTPGPWPLRLGLSALWRVVPPSSSG